MKKTFRFISAAVILSTAAVSCQKEPIQETQSPAVEISSVQKVVYSVDGIYYEDMLVGDSALSDLLHRLLEMAENLMLSAPGFNRLHSREQFNL